MITRLSEVRINTFRFFSAVWYLIQYYCQGFKGKIFKFFMLVILLLKMEI